jgi:general secretion pathway protein G
VAGFSLIELMVVIAIMGLLATVVAVNLMGRTYDAKVKKVMADFDSMKKAIQLFKLDMGKYPQRLDDLWTPPGGAKNWKGPYLENTPPAPSDPWGNPYTYTPPLGSAGKYVITCYGEDGAPGGTAEAQDLTTDNITQISTGAGQ